MQNKKLAVKIQIEKDGQNVAERRDEFPFISYYYNKMCINPASPYVAKLVNKDGKVLSRKVIDFFEADIILKYNHGVENVKA